VTAVCDLSYLQAIVRVTDSDSQAANVRSSLLVREVLWPRGGPSGSGSADQQTRTSGLVTSGETQRSLHFSKVGESGENMNGNGVLPAAMDLT